MALTLKIQETIEIQDYTCLCISAMDMIDLRVLNKAINTNEKLIPVVCEKYSLIQRLFHFIFKEILWH